MSKEDKFCLAGNAESIWNLFPIQWYIQVYEKSFYLNKKMLQIINEIEIFFNYNKNVGTVTLCNCNVEISILIHVCIWGQNGQWKIFVLWLDSMDPFWYCHQTSRLAIEYTQKRYMWNETSNFNQCFANRDFVIIWISLSTLEACTIHYNILIHIVIRTLIVF